MSSFFGYLVLLLGFLMEPSSSNCNMFSLGSRIIWVRSLVVRGNGRNLESGIRDCFRFMEAALLASSICFNWMAIFPFGPGIAGLRQIPLMWSQTGIHLARYLQNSLQVVFVVEMKMHLGTVELMILMTVRNRGQLGASLGCAWHVSPL